MGRNNDTVNANRLAIVGVFNRHLRLCIGAQILNPLVFTADCCQFYKDFMCQIKREGHIIVGFVGRVTEQDRYQSGSLIINSQLPTKLWHDQFADKTLADAIMDRIVHNAEKIELKGESMRKNPAQTS